MTVTESTPEIDAAPTQSTDDVVLDADSDVVEEVLVEEISIDGMCGVY